MSALKEFICLEEKNKHDMHLINKLSSRVQKIHDACPTFTKEFVDWLKTEAIRNDNTSAQNLLGYMYRHAKYFSRSDESAFYWYKRAADGGNACAQNNVALCYEEGYGTKVDIEQAIKYYKLSASRKYHQGLFHLGMAYEDGVGVEKEYALAHKYYKMALRRENYNACYRIGTLYLKEKKYSKALKYLEYGVRLNDVSCMYGLARMYENGIGVDKDKEIADLYYLKGYSLSQKNKTKLGKKMMKNNIIID